eukprot:8921461-Pyramimonas_sp.AAC.1
MRRRRMRRRRMGRRRRRRRSLGIARTFFDVDDDVDVVGGRGGGARKHTRQNEQRTGNARPSDG